MRRMQTQEAPRIVQNFELSKFRHDKALPEQQLTCKLFQPEEFTYSPKYRKSRKDGFTPELKFSRPQSGKVSLARVGSMKDSAQIDFVS